jgi:hypothetical protein
MCLERVSAFVNDPRADSFEELALAAFRFQYEAIEPLRKWCDRIGSSPDDVSAWHEVPAVPTAVYKSVPLHAAEPRIVFRSSGTTVAEQRSEHHHPFPDLYRQVIERSFPTWCLPGNDARPMLSLVPPLATTTDSSLSFMIDHVLETFGAHPSICALGKGGPELPAIRSWLGGRQRDGRAGLLLTTSVSLHQCLEGLERLGLHFRLPPGTAIFETGGTKTLGNELDREQLHDRVEQWLGVPRQRIVQEYGMTELTSQCYTEALSDGDPDDFVCPHWLRVRVLDPETLDEVEPGERGLVAAFDLANLGSAVHVLTEDLAERRPGGFRLIGRARGADLRGCSLTADELRNTIDEPNAEPRGADAEPRGANAVPRGAT